MLWMKLLHLLGAFLWIGALQAIGRTLAAPLSPTEAPALARLARRTYNAWAFPGLLLVLVGGVGMIWKTGMPPGGWMHAKLAMLLLLIVVDQVMRASLPVVGQEVVERSVYWRALLAIVLISLALVLCLSVLRPF